MNIVKRSLDSQYNPYNDKEFKGLKRVLSSANIQHHENSRSLLCGAGKRTGKIHRPADERGVRDVRDQLLGPFAPSLSPEERTLFPPAV